MEKVDPIQHIPSAKPESLFVPNVKQERPEVNAVQSRKSSMNRVTETHSRKASDDLDTLDSDIREKKYDDALHIKI